MTIHINIEDLLSARSVESDRIEFKAGWNPDAVYRSICAFANDYNNSGAGYILIGVKENPVSHIAMRPVAGLTSGQIAEIQKEMIGYNNLIRPYYAPRLFIEEVDGQQIIVLWAFAGNDRPYEVPEQITAKHKIWKYFIRKYASSIEARGIEREELISLSQNIPFDDRPNNSTKITDISLLRLRDYLQQVKSKLAEGVGQGREKEILRQMELISGPEELIFPKNVALMMFNDKPHSFFPYTWVEIVHFPNGPEAKEFIEKRIEGPVHQQITDSLRLLKTQYLEEKVRKIEGKAEAERIWNYPYAALEETVANCIYHRNYQEHEPATIRIEPTSITLYNCGGPDRSLKREDFISGKAIPKRYRNRRLGDFLKELGLTEGHATGLPAIRKAMQQNGSPEAIFDFDEERTWFQVTLPIHPAFRKKQPFAPDLNSIEWNLHSIDNLLNQIIDYVEVDVSGIAGSKADTHAGTIVDKLDNADNLSLSSTSDTDGTLAVTIVSGKTSGKAGDIAGDIADIIKISDNLIVNEIFQHIRDIAGDIAGGISRGMSEKTLKILEISKIPEARKNILTGIGLVNNVKNYNTYLAPLIFQNWITLTIPDKPTSPKQRYFTTLKGRLVLELLKYSPA